MMMLLLLLFHEQGHLCIPQQQKDDLHLYLSEKIGAHP
jgi:hypothetical protein